MAHRDPDFLARVLDALGGFVYVYDVSTGANVFVSRRWGEHFSCSAEDTRPGGDLFLRRLLHPDDASAFEAHLAALGAAVDDRAQVVEFRLEGRDGGTVWISSVDRPLERDASGRVTTVVGDAQDITAQKMAESARAEGEARFDAVVDNLPDAVFIADARARIVQVNDAACSQLGYSREELVKLTIGDFVAPEFRARVAERLSAPSGTATAKESAHIRKDGTRVPVETVVVAMELEGQPVYLGVARDISDRQRLEAQLRDAQRLEAIGRLAGAVAHDFNNILVAIRGGADLLTRHVAAGEEVHRIAGEIGTAATRGADLTRQLLTLGRRQAIDVQPVELADAVETTLKVLRRLLGGSIRIETHLRPNCVVMADPGMIDQVVMNLTLNARDAMPEGGTLMIRVSESTADPDAIEMQFIDTGSGIDARDLSKIFEPYFTTKPNAKGSGIGLATVYGIVAQHGGSIRVESTPGAGSTFYISLPRATGATSARPPEPAMQGPARKLSILLVDDMAQVRSTLAALLRAEGHGVLQADSAAAALELWAEAPASIDLLLTDVALGTDADGPALAHALRQRQPSLLVILMSGYAADRAQLELENGFDFLQKPFSLDELNTLLARRFPSRPEHG